VGSRQRGGTGRDGVDPVWRCGRGIQRRRAVE
jgi:hypothetical protein